MADPNRRLPSDKLEPPDANPPDPKPSGAQPHAISNNQPSRQEIEQQADRGSLGLTGGAERDGGHELER